LPGWLSCGGGGLTAPVVALAQAVTETMTKDDEREGKSMTPRSGKRDKSAGKPPTRRCGPEPVCRRRSHQA
jgi:hypothetical protein